MSKKNRIWFGVFAVLVIAVSAGGYLYFKNAQVRADYQERGVWNPVTYDYDVVPVQHSHDSTETGFFTTIRTGWSNFINQFQGSGSGSSTGGSDSSYSAGSSYESSSSTGQGAVEAAKARCLASETKPGRLRIIIATDKNTKPVSASMSLASPSASGSEVSEEDIVQFGKIGEYGSLVENTEELGISDSYPNVYFTESGQVPSGKYSVNIIVKDVSGTGDSELRQVIKEFEVKPCVHSTLTVSVDSATAKEADTVEDDKFCFTLTTGKQFYGTQEEYISYLANSDGSVGIDSMILGPCEGEAETAGKKSSDDSTGDDVATTGDETTTGGTGVGIRVSDSNEDKASLLFGGGFDTSSLGDSSAALETALVDSKSLDSGAQKLLEGADKSKAKKDQLKRAGKAIESGDDDNEDVQALEERKYTQDDIVAAYEAYQAIEDALAKLDENELLALAKDSIIATGVVEEVLGDEVAEALEQGAQLASDALSEVSGITERTGVAVDLADGWLGSVGAAVNGLLGGLF